MAAVGFMSPGDKIRFEGGNPITEGSVTSEGRLLKMRVFRTAEKVFLEGPGYEKLSNVTLMDRILNDDALEISVALIILLVGWILSVLALK